MNQAYLDPFSHDFPESIQETLYGGYTCSLEFSRSGLLLAAGCADGRVLIWGFDDRSLVRILIGHVAPVTAVSWSKASRHLATSSSDWSVILWDVVSGTQVYAVRFPSPLLSVALHPLDVSKAVVSAYNYPAVLLDFPSGQVAPLPADTSDDWVAMNDIPWSVASQPGSVTRGMPPASSDPMNPVVTAPPASATIATGFDYNQSSPAGTHALWTKNAQYVITASTQGCVLMIDPGTQKIVRKFSSRNVTVRSIAISPSGTKLMVNLANHTLKVLSLPDLTQIRELHDVVNRVAWKRAGFSGDGEYYWGGCAERAEHQIFIWRADSAELVTVLEGPKEGIMDMKWHPRRAIAVSSARDGSLFIWAKHAQETWSAFAPDFKELEENEEYEELEDEFDIIPREQLDAEKMKEEQKDVDIVTCEQLDEVDSDPEDMLMVLPAIISTEPEDLFGEQDEIEDLRLNMRKAAQKRVAASGKANVHPETVRQQRIKAAAEVEAKYMAKHPEYVSDMELLQDAHVDAKFYPE